MQVTPSWRDQWIMVSLSFVEKVFLARRTGVGDSILDLELNSEFEEGVVA